MVVFSNSFAKNGGKSFYFLILKKTLQLLCTAASQILYVFVLFNMGLESQTAVLECLEAGKYFIFV